MSQYQVLARKYRPQTFREIIGQEAIVTTLKNAIKFQRLAHAYLFCGSRGTGKTTIARVFAKALNCPNLTDDQEPCGNCSSCREIALGNSLDVLEIDGASHRGIDDIRQINETVAYASSSGQYKIYIIDEVHMLTKEAFNALLKTLEEPPPKVKFFFATTEPHKVLPTIISRCQRFQLNRIATNLIIDKLFAICSDLNRSINEEAVRIIADHSEGGLRDAESLLDQVLAFHEGDITASSITSMLGMMESDSLFAIDQAGKDGRLAFAFEITHRIFSEGKNLVHFVEMLTEHFRNLLLIKLGGSSELLDLSKEQREKYQRSSALYTQEQCLNVLDFLVEAQQEIRFSSSPRIALEALLLRVLRIHQRVPVDFLIRRLHELEQRIQGSPAPQKNQDAPPPSSKPEVEPHPSPSPLSKSEAAPQQSSPPAPSKPAMESQPSPSTPPPPLPAAKIPAKQQSQYDTLLQFAAVELEGTIQKKPK